jgi:hypothetical protein
MTARSTVWMVHARTGMDGVKGAITLEPGSLVFHPVNTHAGESAFPLDRIRRVRRVRGSPVLEIHLRSDADPQVVGFYFIKPPSLEEGPDTQIGFFRVRRHGARKQAAYILRSANSLKKDEVQRWVDRIRKASGGSG